MLLKKSDLYILTFFIGIGVPRLGKTNYEQKWPPFSNMQLYDSAQTKNMVRFKIVLVLHEKELNWSNTICLDYHNEVKISFEI